MTAGEIKIDGVFPWGRSQIEYRRMFALTDGEMDWRILGCGDGPAAFNAGMSRARKRVVSVDPLYRFSGDEIRQRIKATHGVMVDRARQSAERFVWSDSIRSPEHMGKVRMRAMAAFLADFDRGKRQGRYLPFSLPMLDLPDGSFDLAVCSHFLFLYSAELPETFHLESIVEMLRLAREVRIFPLLDLEGHPSCHAPPVIAALQKRGVDVSVERVDYEFQRDGNQMMRVRS